MCLAVKEKRILCGDASHVESVAGKLFNISGS